MPFFPGSLAVFFAYRVDAYLIVFLMIDPATALGYYSLAVGLAEIVLFFPRAVTTLYFPHVAGSPREESDRQVAATSRVTLLVTGVCALLMVPAATLMVWILLPAYGPSLPALYLLLPGVVAFSVTFALGGYLTGIDRPGITSGVSIVALVTNVVANLILIPRFGIEGAASASLISYSLSSALLTIVVARQTKASFLAFWVPTTERPAIRGQHDHLLAVAYAPAGLADVRGHRPLTISPSRRPILDVLAAIIVISAVVVVAGTMSVTVGPCIPRPCRHCRRRPRRHRRRSPARPCAPDRSPPC